MRSVEREEGSAAGRRLATVALGVAVGSWAWLLFLWFVVGGFDGILLGLAGGLVGSLAAVVVGVVALGRMRRSGTSGRGRALLALLVAGVLAYLTFFGEFVGI